MSGSKKLDELFKKKLGNRKVPYDDASWQKMAAILDESMPVGATVAANTKVQLWQRATFKVAIAAGIVAALGAWWWVSSNETLDFDIKKGESITQTADARESEAEVNQTQSADLEPLSQSGNTTRASKQKKQQHKTTLSAIVGNAVQENAPSASNLPVYRQENIAQTNGNEVSASGNDSQNSPAFISNSYSTISNPSSTAEMNDSPLSENLLGDESNISDTSERQKISSIYMLKRSETQPMQLAFAEERAIELPKVYTHLFSVLAGANLAKDYNTSGASFSGNEFIGLSYEILTPSNFGFGAQLIYQARKGINTSSTFEYIDYSFGKETHLTTIENNRLYYLELPLFASYRIKKSRLHAGISASYLLTSKAEVRNEVYGQTAHRVSTEDELGHTSGLNDLDLALIGGYEFTIRPKLALGLSVSYGLLDVTDNDYFESDVRNTNSQLRFSLKYNLATR